MISITKLHERLVDLGLIEDNTEATWDAIRGVVEGEQHKAGLPLTQPQFLRDLPEAFLVDGQDGTELFGGENDPENPDTRIAKARAVAEEANAKAKAKADEEQAEADRKAEEQRLADEEAARQEQARKDAEAAEAAAKEQAAAEAKAAEDAELARLQKEEDDAKEAAAKEQASKNTALSTQKSGK
jgi:hypothetical protein